MDFLYKVCWIFFFFFCLLLLNCRKGVYEYFNKEVSMEVTFVLLKYHLP